MAQNGQIGPINAPFPPAKPPDPWKFMKHTKVLPKVHGSIASRWDWVVTAFKIKIWSMFIKKYEKWLKMVKLVLQMPPCRAST